MTKEDEEGLLYILDELENFEKKDDREVVIDLVDKGDKTVIKENNIITGIVKHTLSSNVYQDIVEIQESLRKDYDENKS